jgi:Zn-dependent peptidase ImmA (M78 family)
MMDDYRVRPRSTKDIEAVTLAWRDALGISHEWAPDVVRLLESKVPKLIKEFALIVRDDTEMVDIEAYTEFNPPHIAICNSVYNLARKRDGRSRMTFAHELGHLVMHPGIAKLRAEGAVRTVKGIRFYESAEWQAKKFASLFLMPQHIIIEFSNAHQIAECCQVSAQAASIRFEEIKPLLASKQLAPCVQEAINEFTK